jgi:UDP-N-acetylglucosamine transferase subunit ALG13
MIVVTTGTNEQAFDRLVRAVARLRITEDLLVQHGSSREAHGAGEWVDFLAFDTLADAMRRSRVVVCHAGVGSIMLARRCGRTPVVMARRVALGEAVDDHQWHLARRLAGIGLVRMVEDEAELAAALAAPLADPGTAVAAPAVPAAAGTLAAEIAEFLAARGVAPVAG